MNRYLVIWTKYSDISEQVTDRTIKLMISVIQSKPWSINFVITLKVYIGPIELKWANKRIALAPKFCIVDVKENFGSVKLFNCHVGKLEEKLFVKDGIVCSRFDLMLKKYDTDVCLVWSLTEIWTKESHADFSAKLNFHNLKDFGSRSFSSYRVIMIL